MSKYSPEPYKSEGGFSIAGLPVLFFILFVVAAGLGWLASFISQWFYLIILFPLLMGFGLIATGIFVGKLTKMRNIGIAALAGLMSGAVAIATMHYCDYLRFRSQIAALPNANQIQVKPGVDKAQLMEAIEKVKSIGFFQYLNGEAKQGVTIGRRGGGVNIGYTGTWIYWGIEFLVVAGMTMLGLAGSATEPFCNQCEKWKELRKLGSFEAGPSSVTPLLQEGDLDALRKCEPSQSEGSLHLSAYVCPSCQDQGDISLKLEQVTTNAKGEESRSELVHLRYPGTALAELQALFNEPDEAEDEDEVQDVLPSDKDEENEEDEDDRPRRKR